MIVTAKNVAYFELLLRNLLGRTDKTTKKSHQIFGNYAENRTGYLSNIIHERYRYTNLLGAGPESDRPSYIIKADQLSRAFVQSHS
jgi:hypothetical protein